VTARTFRTRTRSPHRLQRKPNTNALQETFPTSDPVSPFVPAVRSSDEPKPDHGNRCAHPACTCTVSAPEVWCSDACRDQQQGYSDAHATCACGHAICLHSASTAPAA
jgi:hypothetical protein